ncbi:MAG TPA: OmpH family outer membrane protein, partial [Niabella sp.]|nr:OmpH family outer membrane protein [Niabella sp.]
QSMTEAEAEAARQDLEASQNQMAERRQRLYDEFNSFVANKNMSLKKKIEDFLKEFNADNTYSFIFAYEPGLFYYKDTAYDITNEVLKGLNEKQKSSKK